MSMTGEKLFETSSDRLTAERYGKPIPLSEPPHETAVTGQLLSRRSHRAFRDDKVSESILTYLLACAQSAPSKSDLQQYSIIVVDDLELKEQISSLPGIDAWVCNAPHLLVFCADLRRGWQITESKGFTSDNNTLDMLVNSTGDAAIAMMAFIVAAESMGFGCCPVSVVRNQIEQVSALLKLPIGLYPFAGLCFGYPAENGQTSIRLPQEVVVHRNHYDDSHLLQHLHTYDNIRHDLTPIPEAKQLHPDRYGIQPEIKWSDNVARRLSVRERKTFRAFLEQQNFALE
jgi:nitroreductase/FMN reductase [NAD(P)H]